MCKIVFLKQTTAGFGFEQELSGVLFLFSVFVEDHHQQHTIQQLLKSEPNYTVPGNLDLCKALDMVLDSL